MAKKRKEAKTSEDLISRLPDEVLTHILSYLPTQTSVKTSVLSKRWSRLWLSVPNLDFDDCYFSSSISRAQFGNFMDRFLSLNNVRSVRTIYFLLGWDPEVSRVNAWLAAFGDRDAEKVDLTLSVNNEEDDLNLSFYEYFTPIYSLPDTFLNQNNLVKLRLTAVVLKVPQLVCFPNLKKMTLKSVQLFDETSMKNLLCGSPVLKTLKVYLYTVDNVQSLHICSFSLHSLILHVEIESNHDYDVVIDSPSLTYLSLTDISESSYNITNASLLASVYLHTVTVEQLLKLLTQITHVKKLHFAIYFMSDLHEIMHANLPMLLNLIHLTVEVCHAYFGDGKYFGDGGSLSHLLHCTPNIVTFSIKKVSRDDSYDWFEPYEVPQCFLSSIKSVDIKWVGDGDRDLQMIAYILKNAMVLNKLSIICDKHKLVGVNKTKFITTLLTLPRSSATCEVEYNLEYNDRGLF